MIEGVTDYGHDLLFGAFITPTAADPEQVVGLAQLAERAGLDLATVQDHPYQPAHLDAWTLLSYLAASTERISLSANVLNLPLRQPLVLARSAASLDRLSGGRVELGLGAGAFWEAIEAAGGRRLSPRQAVDALAEAIAIIRAVWAADEPGGIRLDGEYYRVVGAKRGPAPAHGIGVWLGAYKPRMLALTGRAADGWVPSLAYLKQGPAELDALNEQIDDAATAAGRAPAAVRRLLNIGGRFTAAAGGLLVGPPKQWVEEVADLALRYGVSGFILASDDPRELQTFAAEVAPAVRELVAEERSGATAPAAMVESNEELWTTPALRARPTATPAAPLGAGPVWDETTRPQAPAPPAGIGYSDQGQAVGQHLIDVHDHLRSELDQVRDIVDQVRAGRLGVGRARSAINEMTMRQNDWTLGAYCATYCRTVTTHHSLEDAQVFPHLRRADPGLVPVIDRLEAEHRTIHDVLEGVDAALIEHVRRPDDFTGLQAAVDRLTDALLSHLAYEEQQIVEPLARLGFYPGQV